MFIYVQNTVKNCHTEMMMIREVVMHTYVRTCCGWWWPI